MSKKEKKLDDLIRKDRNLKSISNHPNTPIGFDIQKAATIRLDILKLANKMLPKNSNIDLVYSLSKALANWVFDYTSPAKKQKLYKK